MKCRSSDGRVLNAWNAFFIATSRVALLRTFTRPPPCRVSTGKRGAAHPVFDAVPMPEIAFPLIAYRSWDARGTSPQADLHESLGKNKSRKFSAIIGICVTNMSVCTTPRSGAGGGSEEYELRTVWVYGATNGLEGSVQGRLRGARWNSTFRNLQLCIEWPRRPATMWVLLRVISLFTYLLMVNE